MCSRTVNHQHTVFHTERIGIDADFPAMQSLAIKQANPTVRFFTISTGNAAGSPQDDVGS